MSEKYTEYDLKKSFKDDGMEEHIQALLKYCKIKKIPFFASFALINSQDGTIYDNYMVSPGLEGIDLKDDMIRKHALIYKGFDISPIGAVNLDHDKDLDSYLNDADFDVE